ncbi:MAG: sulfatase [Candidatus Schekmanbacteria bacterium]|nr:sulfatase [Candidatus Schekmanbacteria bacterium]
MGIIRSLLIIASNNYINLKFYKNILFSFLNEINTSIIYIFKLTSIVIVFYLIIYYIFKDFKKTISLLIGIFISLYINLTLIYNLNRYTFKDYWKSEKNFFGYSIPNAIFSLKIISINLFFIVSIIITAFILFKLLLTLFSSSKLSNIKSIKLSKKYFVIYFILLILIFINLAGFIIWRNSTSGMNIVLITVDSLRADHLGCYGYNKNTSPNIDRLADSGVLFSRSISQAPWTLPSYMSMLTSKYVYEHGVDVANKILNPRVITLAEILRENGYYTAGFVSAPFLKRSYGLDQGFDVYNEDAAASVSSWSHNDITSPTLTKLIISFFRQNSSKKFFLFLHYWDPHYDYIPPSPYDKLFDPGYQGNMDGRKFKFNNNFKVGMDERDYNHIVSLYDGEIRWTDMHIGLLLKELNKLGLEKKTIIIFTSDHGDEFLEHGYKGHEHSLYDELIHVPLIVKLPDVKFKAKKIDTTVETIDISPTILNLVGIGSLNDFRGESILPLISGVGEYTNSKAISETSKGFYGEYKSIEIDKVKYIVRSDKKNELYDLKTDPTEKKNIYKEQSELGKHFESEIYKHLYHRNSADDSKKALINNKINKETSEQLKTLGYIN